MSPPLLSGVHYPPAPPQLPFHHTERLSPSIAAAGVAGSCRRRAVLAWTWCRPLGKRALEVWGPPRSLRRWGRRFGPRKADKPGTGGRRGQEAPGRASVAGAGHLERPLPSVPASVQAAELSQRPRGAAFSPERHRPEPAPLQGAQSHPAPAGGGQLPTGQPGILRRERLTPRGQRRGHSVPMAELKSRSRCS